MIYFALCANGNLLNLGFHFDWESAESKATDLQIDQIWVFDEKVATQWADYINQQMKG